MSDIGTMVSELISAGCIPEVAARVVAQAIIFGVSSGGHRVDAPDASAERRRAWDRQRKREQRGLRLPGKEWFPLVGQILKRDGHKCTYCAAVGDLTADHVVPLTRGGSNHPSNLTACCLPCNTKKGSKLVSEWDFASSTVFHPTVHLTPQMSESASLSSSTTSLERERERKVSVRGQRLPDDWVPSPQDEATAFALIGEPRAAAELEKFRDHWKQQPGQKGVKLDWAAAWRNWIRRSAEYRGNRNGQDGSKIIQAADDLRRKIASFDGPSSQDIGIRDGAGPVVARLLSHGGCERS